jgi:tRNA(Ile)-lysidine synthase
MAVLQKSLEQAVSQLPTEVGRYVVAYSGGRDSHVLLHALSREADYRRHVTAVHVHHGLQSEADAWADHCRRQCDALSVSLEVHSVEVSCSPGDSLEAVARTARYALFKQLMQPGDVLLTAHHQRDQAETLLLQLLRGAGLSGMAAMPEVTPLGQGLLCRPLLRLSQVEVDRYAKDHVLSWIEDPSNQDMRFDRNYLRQQVLPLLESRWPSYALTLSRSAQCCAQAAELTVGLARDDLQRVCHRDGTLDISDLRAWPAERTHAVLRVWLSDLSLPSPRMSHQQHIVDDVILARPDSSPCVRWVGCEIRRYRQRLYAMKPLQEFDHSQNWTWSVAENGECLPLKLPHGVLELSTTQAQCWAGQDFVVRFRQGGEKGVMPDGHHHALKKLFQSWGVPPWMRDRVPLIFHHGELLTVVGFGCCITAMNRSLDVIFSN